MDAEFWHERWRNDQIGFHQGRVNEYLERHYAQWDIATGAPVLVPLCGKSLDMLWLRDRGHPVVGVELSQIAVEAFFREQGLSVRRHARGAFSVYETEGIRVLCGDFFAVTVADIGAVGGVYDRAALIALPPPMRPRYVTHLAALVSRDMRGLLITLEYPDGQMQGPPFSVPEAEVMVTYPAQGFRVERLEDHDALAGNTRLRERGVTALREKVYRVARS